MIEVLRPGLLTTVQDTGRAGFSAQGVPRGGALDPLSLRIANLLVGNAQGAAGLEVTLTGLGLRFASDALVAVTGADVPLLLAGEPVPGHRPVRVRAGEALELGPARRGCRAYLAFAGGVELAPVLGSRATALLGAFGGLQGRALRQGDRLPLGVPSARAAARMHALDRDGHRWPRWSAAADLLPGAPDDPIRLLPGAHAGLLDETSRGRLFGGPFRVGPASDRMGCRLQGEPLALLEPVELSSEGVAPGTVQLPPGGEPIVLLADAGTTGGYPRIGHVATVDLPRLAQLRPGDSLRFAGTTLEEAHRLLRLRERELSRLGVALDLLATR